LHDGIQEAAQTTAEGPLLDIEAATAPALALRPRSDKVPVGLGSVRVLLVGRAVVEGEPSLSVPPFRGKETHVPRRAGGA
jgi:hypothetical protein